MRLEKSLVSALLFLTILGAGARAGSAQQVQPLEPEWLRQMYSEGWRKVQEGVLQRETEEGDTETLSYGAEGLQWAAQRYRQQVTDLKSRSGASPSKDTSELIGQLEDQILRLEGTIGSALSAESFDGEMLMGCNFAFGGHASAKPLLVDPGVTATARAYFNNDCGYVGDTNAKTYAEVISPSGTTNFTHSDPKNGTVIVSNSNASAQRSDAQTCWAWAEGSVTVYGMSIYYNIARKQTYRCGPLLYTGWPDKLGVPTRPASTLLLPYFKVDLDNSEGINTLFSINNAAASAQLAHVTIWTTWSVPVLGFNVYLTGFDTQTFNLRDILASGLLSQTGSGISPQGPLSDSNTSFPGCNSSASPTGAPVYPIPSFGTAFQTHLTASLTGQPSTILGGKCSGRDYGDNIARGYITVDDVNSCSLLFPSDPGYFVSGGLGVAGNDNVLWGDYFYLNPSENYAQGETLVHIRADAETFNTPGEYTFYGRYVGGTAADNRQPLATSFATRYAADGTELIVWRDSKRPPAVVSCGSEPSYGQLSEQIVVFDESENLMIIETGETSETPCIFCDATQSVRVGDGLPTNADAGWIYLNLNHGTANNLGSGYEGIAQAWVTTILEMSGRFSIGYDAIQLENANREAHPGDEVPEP